MIVCDIIVHLLIIVQNNNKTLCNVIPCHSHYIFFNMFPLSLGHHQENVTEGVWHKLCERTQSLRVQLKLPSNYRVLWYCVNTYVGKYTRKLKALINLKTQARLWRNVFRITRNFNGVILSYFRTSNQTSANVERFVVECSSVL